MKLALLLDRCVLMGLVLFVAAAKVRERGPDAWLVVFCALGAVAISAAGYAGERELSTALGGVNAALYALAFFRLLTRR